MFQGDDANLVQTMRRAVALARDLHHPRVGSEHLLLALVEERGRLSELLAGHAVSWRAVRRAVDAAAPAGAGAAADRDALTALGISIDGLLDMTPGVLDRPSANEPLLTLGLRRARECCARTDPPLGLDAQAAYEASLRLALARREREHRPEHLALALIALDPGIDWVLAKIATDAGRLLADMSAAFPPPRRNRLIRAERRLGRRSRDQSIMHRYQTTSGRVTTAATTGVPRLLTG